MAKKMWPGKLPQITRAEARADALKYGLDIDKEEMAVVLYRGYFRDSMGTVGANDSDVFDDAAVVATKKKYLTANANTDPYTSSHPDGKPTLKAGIVWRVYRFSLHKGKYMALCQRGGNVTVIRSKTGKEDTGLFGINFHKGGQFQTSSEGCPTVYGPQYDALMGTMIEEAKRIWGEELVSIPVKKGAKPVFLPKWQTVDIPVLVIEKQG